MNETITASVIQVKAASARQRLEFNISRQLADGGARNTSVLYLTGYSILGTVSGVPPIVALEVEGVDATPNYITFVGPNVNASDLRANYYIIYPPGNLTSESRSRQRVAHKADGGLLNFAHPRLRLLSYDASVGQWVEWNDWTSCVLTFELTCSLFVSNTRKTLHT